MTRNILLLYFKQGMSAAAGYASLEYGASIRIRRLQINFTMARGLVNMAKITNQSNKTRP